MARVQHGKITHYSQGQLRRAPSPTDTIRTRTLTTAVDEPEFPKTNALIDQLKDVGKTAQKEFETLFKTLKDCKIEIGWVLKNPEEAKKRCLRKRTSFQDQLNSMKGQIKHLELSLASDQRLKIERGFFNARNITLATIDLDLKDWYNQEYEKYEKEFKEASKNVRACIKELQKDTLNPKRDMLRATLRVKYSGHSGRALFIKDRQDKVKKTFAYCLEPYDENIGVSLKREAEKILTASLQERIKLKKRQKKRQKSPPKTFPGLDRAISSAIWQRTSDLASKFITSLNPSEHLRQFSLNRTQRDQLTLSHKSLQLSALLGGLREDLDKALDNALAELSAQQDLFHGPGFRQKRKDFPRWTDEEWAEVRARKEEHDKARKQKYEAAQRASLKIETVAATKPPAPQVGKPTDAVSFRQIAVIVPSGA